MNFTAYIERQKSIIRHRHDGETYLLQRGEEVAVIPRATSCYTSLTALKDLTNVKD